MKPDQHIYSSADDRRLHADNPYIVLELVPPTTSAQVEVIQAEATRRMRQASGQYHPDRTFGDAVALERFQQIQSAHKKIENSGSEKALEFSYTLIFGSLSAHWTPGMKEVAFPIVDALTEAVHRTRFLDIPAIACQTCEEQGFTVVNLDGHYLPLPVPCRDCAGEGALPACIAALRDALSNTFYKAGIFEPHWRKDDAEHREVVLPSAEERQLAVLPCETLKECIKRYVLANPALCTKPFITQMCSNLIAICNQAIEFRHSLSTLCASYSHAGAVQRILDDCAIGISYVESRRGRREAQKIIEEQGWETFVATGRTLRLKQEKELSTVRKTNLFPVKIDMMGSVKIEKSMISQLADDVLKSEWTGVDQESHFASFQGYHRWHDAVLQAKKLLTQAFDVGVAADSCKDALAMPGFSHLIHHDGTQRMGFHELAILVASFCEAYGETAESIFTLSQESFVHFSKIFTYDQNKKRYSPDASASKKLCAAAKRLFPDAPHASAQCLMALQSMCDIMETFKREALPSQFRHREENNIETSLRAAFPNAASLDYYYRLSDVETGFTEIMKEEALGSSADRVGIRGVALKQFPLLSDILTYSPAKIDTLAQSHSSALDWRGIVEQGTAKEIAAVLAALFSTHSIPSQGIACDLFLLLVSTEEYCPDAALSPDVLFEDGSKIYKKISGKAYKSIEVVKLLDTESLRYLITYSGIIARSYPSLKQYLQFLSEQTVYSPENSLDLWHPHWEKVDPEALVKRVEKRIEAEESIDTMLPSLLQHPSVSQEICSSILLEAAHSAPKVRGSYVQTCLRLMPKEYINEACTTVIASLLNFDSHISDHMLEIAAELDLSDFNEAALDVPLSFFIDPHGTTLRRFPASWGKINSFIESIADYQEQLVPYLQQQKDESSADRFSPDLAAEQIHRVTLFTSKNFREKDMPTLVQITSEEHPYLSLIIKNFLQSKPKIQQKILTECLRGQDAIAAIVSLVADVAQKNDDSMLSGDLLTRLSTPKKGKIVLPPSYALLGKVLAENSELKKDLLCFLEQNKDLPLRELAAVFG